MLWWIGAAVVWLCSAGWIFMAMAEVFRGKESGLSKKIMTMYAFHGVTALLALWLAFKAVA